MRFNRHLLAAACAAFVLTHADAAPRTVGAVVHTVPSADGADLSLSSGARVHVGFVTPDVIDWYRRFAEGKPGVIVVEATGIREVPSGPLLRIGHDRFIEGLTKLLKP